MSNDTKSAGKKPSYNAYASGPSENSPLLKIGAAWDVSKGGISLKLVATPTDGKIILFPAKEEDAE